MDDYNNLEISGETETIKEYYIKLVEQQAKNIYLNIKDGRKS